MVKAKASARRFKQRLDEKPKAKPKQVKSMGTWKQSAAVLVKKPEPEPPPVAKQAVVDEVKVEAKAKADQRASEEKVDAVALAHREKLERLAAAGQKAREEIQRLTAENENLKASLKGALQTIETVKKAVN
jgi:hypothetical protein